MQIGILEPKDFSKDAINILSQVGDVLFYNKGTIESFISDKDILFVRLKYFIGKNLIDRASKLKYICSPTTGLNHLDIDYAKQKDIKIISLKGETSFLSDIRATSEHTFGLILSLLRNYKYAFIKNKNEFDRDKFKGYEIYNSSIGIIGFGRIGRLLASYITAFGGKVFFYDVNRDIDGGNIAVKINNLENLVRNCNVICLCASYNKEIVINAKIIDILKGKFFINTARGELVDEDYLIRKIEDGHFAGVALDVIKNESTSKDNLSEFLKINKKYNFILTPHIGGATYTSMERTEYFIATKLKRRLIISSDKQTISSKKFRVRH